MSVKQLFENMLLVGVKMNNFLKSHQDIIALFVDAEIVAALIKADGEYTSCGKQVKAMMSAHF